MFVLGVAVWLYGFCDVDVMALWYGGDDLVTVRWYSCSLIWCGGHDNEVMVLV